MTKVWLDAGFRTEQVDLEGRKLVFRRVSTSRVVEPPPVARKGERHPAFGALKGLIVIPPGVDLTEPADPGWADLLDEKYGPQVR
jgi:hypothetical protein